MKKIKTSVIVSATAIVLTVAAAILVNTTGKNGSDLQKQKSKSSSSVSVSTAIAEKTTLHDYVSVNGEIESQNSVNVFPDMGGKILSTSVMLGSTVKKGDIIAYIDPSEPGTNYRSSPVYAPISGSIISTPLKNGTKVTTSDSVAIIGDINNLQISANVPERYVAVLKKGLKANVSVEAYPNVIFNATVSRVSPVVDSVSRTKQVILTFDKNDSRINAGMFAKVKLYTQDYPGQIVIKETAVVENSDEFFAYVVNEDNTVSKRKVTKGKTVDGFVQILDGINEGEKIVVQGMASLGDGSVVQEVKGE